MKTLKLTSEQLRYKFKHIDSILQDRNVCNDDEIFTLFNKFYDVILETIAAAMDDYIQYADADINFEDLIGGIPVAERVDSIIEKIDNVFMQ